MTAALESGIILGVYVVDHRDRVVGLTDLPQCSVGAPCPQVVADEHRLDVVFYVASTPPGWHGTYVTVVDPSQSGEPAAVVRFHHRYAMYFGPPNDEAFEGHPLASRGLAPYGAYEVLESSWIRQLERMNAVHERHDAGAFAGLRHFVLAFHDSILECVARRYTVKLSVGPLTGLAAAQLAPP